MDIYWTEGDIADIEASQTYTDLLVVARRVLDRMPRPRVLVSGPITTGGAGSRTANIVRFDAAILALRNQGLIVFDQLPFGEAMRRIHERRSTGYDMALLDDFYLPIFKERLIDDVYFLSDWQSSIGSSWEHERAKEFGLRIAYLP